jgi:hypothetical protein
MPGPINTDDLQVPGGDSNKPRLDFPLSNWASIVAVSTQAVNVPHTQTSASATCVACISLTAFFTGLFEYSCRASFSDGTTGGVLISTLLTSQGAGAGLVSGGVAAAKFGAGAASIALSQGATANGQILNVDAAGGAGLRFEGLAFGGVAQHTDTTASLTGLLTPQGAGVDSFSFYGMADAQGALSLTKTPFTLGKPVAFALIVSATAAHVITYNSLNMFVRELPVA